MIVTTFFQTHFQPEVHSTISVLWAKCPEIEPSLDHLSRSEKVEKGDK
jgi:hypothetical protein